MGWMSHRRKAVELRPEQKWDYITIGDFKSKSCFTPLAYGYLWMSVLISVAVYAIDTFTAVNILVFDRFFERFDEEDLNFISRNVAKWIFTVCIILSFLNLFYEYIRAWKIMKRGSVAECYLDNIAVRSESLRFGKGQGWRRFLVFAELTKSKKGAEYVALFTYFNFQSWVRVLICSGPRQAVNALVLYAFVTSEIEIRSDDDIQTGLQSIFDAIKSITSNEPFFAMILSGMLFTLVVFVFSFIGLLISFFFYIFYLWYRIPRSDGGLSGYCDRKINKRLMKIVSATVNKAIAKEDQARLKAEKKAAEKNGESPPEERKATIPTFMDEDKLPMMPSLQRTNTVNTLPVYSSRPSSAGSSFEMGSIDQKYPHRNNTNVSGAHSYSSNTSLVNGAAGMGYSSTSSAPSHPALDMGVLASPSRTTTLSSARSYGSQKQSPRIRVPNSPAPYPSAYTQSPSTYNGPGLPPMPSPPSRSITNASLNSSYSRPSAGPGRQGPGPSRPPYVGGQSNYANDYSSNGRASPAPSNYSQGSNSIVSPRHAYPQQASQPMRSATGPIQSRGPQYAPSRNMTAPMPPHHQQHQQHDYFGDSNDYDYNGDVESQRGPRY